MPEKYDTTACYWAARNLVSSLHPNPFATFVIVVEGINGGPPTLLHNTLPRGAVSLLKAGLTEMKATPDS